MSPQNPQVHHSIQKTWEWYLILKIGTISLKLMEHLKIMELLINPKTEEMKIDNLRNRLSKVNKRILTAVIDLILIVNSMMGLMQQLYCLNKLAVNL